MLEYLFDNSLLDFYARKNTPNLKFITFKEKGNNIFGASSQIVTNCGTSMLTNSTGTVPEIHRFIQNHFNTNNVAINYLRERIVYPDSERITEEYVDNVAIDKFIGSEKMDIKLDPIISLMRSYLHSYKSYPKFRQYVNSIIFEDINKFKFKQNIPIAFFFIVFSLYFVKDNNIFSKKNQKETEYKVAKRYYNSEEEFLSKYVEVLQSDKELTDLSDCNVGQYRFVDFHLRTLEEIRSFPQILVHLLIDNSGVIMKYCAYKASKHSKAKSKSKDDKKNES